jgi:hypothetical protein
MALTLTIVITLVLVLLGLIGYVRDTRRGLMALAGTLLGAIMVDFWGPVWGPSLAARVVGGDAQRLTFVVNSLLFLWSALIVGYAGGALLNRPKERPLFAQRLSGALLGVLNGVLIVGYLLRYATANQPGFAATVQNTPLARIFHDGLSSFFLLLTAGVTVLVLARGVMGLLGRQAVPTKAMEQKPATPTPASGGDARVGDRDVLNKIKDVTRR